MFYYSTDYHIPPKDLSISCSKKKKSTHFSKALGYSNGNADSITCSKLYWPQPVAWFYKFCMCLSGSQMRKGHFLPLSDYVTVKGC